MRIHPVLGFVATLSVVAIVAPTHIARPKVCRAARSTLPKSSRPSIAESPTSNSSNCHAAAGPNCPATTAASPLSARSRSSIPACPSTTRSFSKGVDYLRRSGTRQDLHRLAPNDGPLRCRTPRKTCSSSAATRNGSKSTKSKRGQRKGAWSYPGPGGDNSNSQFAVLALFDAQRVGVEVSRDTWAARRQLLAHVPKMATAPGATSPATPEPAA